MHCTCDGNPCGQAGADPEYGVCPDPLRGFPTASFQMFCRLSELGPLIPHRLERDDGAPCALVPLPQQDGHVHGPTCGHEAVPHAEHIDYLVSVASACVIVCTGCSCLKWR